MSGVAYQSIIAQTWQAAFVLLRPNTLAGFKDVTCKG